MPKGALTGYLDVAQVVLYAFWIFFVTLMSKQEAYFDEPSRTRNPDQIRAELANLAVSVLGEGPKRSKSKPIVSLPHGQPLGQTVRNLLKVGEGNEFLLQQRNQIAIQFHHL